MATLSEQDMAQLNAASLDDLYAQLGRAADPGEPLVGFGEGSLNKMRIEGYISAARIPDWIQRGIAYFESVWATVSSTVCAIYRDYSEIDANWIQRVAEAIVALLHIGWAVAVIIVQIAIRRGLDALCPA